MEYKEFIKRKKKKAIPSGFDVNDLNPTLKPHQKFGVLKALHHGRFALFYDTGLGKTIMQLEWAKQITIKSKKSVLILAPLSVVEQTKQEADRFGYDMDLIHVINYEKVQNLDVIKYSGVVLDESSILKNTDGKTKKIIIDTFQHTPYKLCCSATPSPNDHMELGNHSEFLGYMSYTEMLAMFFVHDGAQSSKWRLRKHAENDFWDYVLSWSVAMDNPATFGFESQGYELPKIKYIEHIVECKSNNADLFGQAIVSATDLHKELKRSLGQRVEITRKIIESTPNEQFLIWGLSNEECYNLQTTIPDSYNVHGSLSPEKKSEKLNGFKNGEPYHLITKTKIGSMGLNYQHCANMVFTAYDFSFEKFYQAVRRIWRFGQSRECNIHILVPQNQVNVIKEIKLKQDRHLKMMQSLAKRASIFTDKKKTMTDQKDLITDDFKCLKGDCVQRAKDISDNELDLVVFSPPFSELYVYSDKLEDMGNSKNYKEFEQHFKYLIPEIKRTLKDGRICAIHCMDLPIQKGKEGFIGLRDFSGMLIDWFTSEGFIYHARTTIWKNPVTEMQRTKAMGLLHKTIKKDSSMSRVGIPDYVLFFRNEGKNGVPITHQDTDPSGRDYLPVDLWQKYASPVWMDVDYSRTLQYTSARDGNDEKHICPLQLDTIERCIHLYSNEGETVGSFFGGIGSEGYQALRMGRKSVSIELKDSYFEVNKRNHVSAIKSKSVLELF